MHLLVGNKWHFFFSLEDIKPVSYTLKYTYIWPEGQTWLSDLREWYNFISCCCCFVKIEQSLCIHTDDAGISTLKYDFANKRFYF